MGSQLYLMPTWEEFQRVIKDALVDVSEKDVNKLIQHLDCPQAGPEDRGPRADPD